MVAAIVILGLLSGILTVLVISLLRSHGEILRALHDLGITLDPFQGDEAPATEAGIPRPRQARSRAAHDLVGTVPGGGVTQIGVAGADQPTLLAFLTTGCLTCRSFWESLAEPVDVAGARVVIVTKDPAEESESAVAELSPPGVPVVMSTSAWDEHDVEVAPYFVLADPQKGIVGEGAAATWDQVRRLMVQSVSDTSLPSRMNAAEALKASGIGPGHSSLRPPLAASNTESGGGD